MSPFSTLTAVLGILLVFFTDRCWGYSASYIAFDGQLELFSEAYYKTLLLIVNFNIPNRCYNIDCANFDNKVESAKWSGLPTTGLAGKAYITFYADKNCGGTHSTAQLPHNGGIREFPFKKVGGNISSFMVRSQSKVRRNGITDVCSWAGADVSGGSVSENANN